jgi:hypothetical protein
MLGTIVKKESKNILQNSWTNDFLYKIKKDGGANSNSHSEHSEI